MRKFFRRLSSKDSKLAPSYHHNGYNSSKQLDEARSTDVVSAVNPAFAAFQPRETSPQQRDLNGNDERDHQSEDTNHEYLPADLARQPSSASARSFTSALNYSNGSALSPGSSHGKQHHHHPRRSHSQSVSGSIYNSSDAESILSAQLGANDTASEGGWQPSRSSQKHSRSLSNSSDQYHRSTSMSPYLGRHSTSASSQTNGEHYPHGRVAPRSLPQSIYRSYDSDILSSGDHMLDRQDPLLATAPSADWIVRQASLQQSPVHRQDSLRRHSSKSRHGYSHSPKPPLARYADGSSLSPRRSGRLNEGVTLSASPSSQHGHKPYKSTMRETHQPQQHPVTTPFAKYAQVSKSPSVDSQDLDTAMRGAAQAFSQRANMQADGVNGGGGETATTSGSVHTSLPPKEMDFMYSPMRANLHSHSFSSCHSRTSSPDEVQHSTSREELTSSSPARQLQFTQQHSSNNHHQPNGALQGNQPGAHTRPSDLSRHSSSASRHRSIDMPSSPYAGDAAQQGGSFSPTGASRRASFDSKPHSPPANHPPVLSSQRPSSTWTQPAPSNPPAAYVPHSNAPPGRQSHRPAQSLHRQLSMRSNISSLPDIDELDSSFTSTGTEEDAPQPRTPPSPSPHSASARQSRYSPPAGQAQTLQGLFRQQSMMSSTPALPNIDEQPSASAVKAPESSSVETQTEQGFPMPTATAVHDAVLQTDVSTGQKAEESDQPERASDSGALTVLDDSPLQIPVLGVATAEAQTDAADAAQKGDHAGRSCSQQVQEAHKQIEEALQAAEQQVAALRGRVSKKHSQLADARHQLDVTRGELCDVCASQHRAPPSLPDTESSDQTDIAAAEIQLLRQALDKLQSETQTIDDELAKAREKAIFSELECAELRHELETVTAQLKSCEASKSQLESTISKLLSDVKGYKPDASTPALMRAESLRSRNSFNSSQSLGVSRSASGQLVRSISADSKQKDVVGLENEVDILRFELESAKAKMESEVAKAREEAFGIMKATGDADAEVKRLMTESVELSSAQQETEAHLQQSQQTINELQAALRTAQLAMLNHKTEQEQAQATITQLHLQQQQQQRQQHLDSQDCLSLSEAAELTQQLADLNKQNSDLGSNNAELSTDLGRALDVAQRVMEQKQGLQEQCRLQQEQLKQEQHRVHELEGFAEEAMTALEVQTQENARLRQQMASDTARMPANSHEPTLVSPVS